MSDSLHQILQSLDASKAPSAPTRGALFGLAAEIDLRSVAYLGMRLPGQIGTPLVLVTYPDEWVNRYVAQNYVEIDPVVHETANSILPTDWGALRRKGKRVRQMFGEAREFGLGERGLTVPIRGRSGDLAFFSVTAERSDAEWAEFKRRWMPTLQLVGYAFHQHVLSDRGIDPPRPTLSGREQSVLSYAAQGLTAVETANRIGLSERTVEMYLTLARAKLHASNTTQAVARAIMLGLVTPAY